MEETSGRSTESDPSPGIERYIICKMPVWTIWLPVFVDFFVLLVLAECLLGKVQLKKRKRYPCLKENKLITLLKDF